MTDLSQRIAALTPEQRAVFELLRKQKRKAPSGPQEPEPIPLRRPGEPLPLSYDQERLWFLYYLDPEASAYNIDNATRMEGPLNIPAIRAALNEVVRRHETWRTTFPAVLGRPVQEIAPKLELAIPILDLSALPEALREPLALRLSVEEFRDPFDLAAGPLVRARLLRVAPDDHFCILTVHHIVTDWVSFQLFWRELATLYETFSAGRPSPLAPLPIQYADFALWQRDWLQGETLQRYVDFWLEELRDAPQMLDLPTDRPRPATQTTRGRAAYVEVPPETAERLRALARKEGATPFMGVLAAFNALLFRWSGQERILIGSPNANRNRVEIEPLLGFFLTQLVFATDLSGNPSFRELLHRERGTALRAYEHQDLPFGKLVEALRPERDASRAPLVQVNLLLLDAEATVMELPELKITALKLDDGVSRFDMTLGLWDGARGITGWFEYNTDLFDHTTMLRMVEAFETLIARVGEQPDTRLADLPLMSEAARQQMLVEWCGEAEQAEGRTVDRLFEEQAAATPDSVAVIAHAAAHAADDTAGELRATYGELCRRANRLAHHLRGLGAGRGARVGLCLDRSLEWVAGMLGIWKAGAAYVPIDPGYPRDRIDLLLEDAGIGLVVSKAGLPGGPREGVREVLFDGPEALAGEPEENPSGERAGARDLAYVLYTSGTTGRPKGAMVEHGNLASTLAASRRAFGWKACDRIPSLAPASFDIFLFELLNPLLVGGLCELVPIAPVLDLPRLLAALPRATRLHAVPALMRQLMGMASPASRYPYLSTLFVGGDAVPADLLADLRSAFPGAEVRVLYGPTEGTIICASLKADGTERTGTLLGRPLPGAVLRLRDANGGLPLIGVPGEVSIGGGGVTRGYLGRDELTAERFAEAEGRRWFRTGDLARWLPDGTLEFLGRADQQVKVRGFRIEPGEVEAALTAHPEVREAVVLARPVAGGDKRLVAYVTPAAAAAPVDGDALRAFLASRLPEHMVPGSFVLLPELPLTVHGKVDRKALLRIEPGASELPGEVTPPRTPAEEALAGIWRNVLGIDRLGVHDNFFRLGGDSILSIQVVARAREAGLAVTPRQMFENQTIAMLASVATPLGETGKTASVEPFALAGAGPETLAARLGSPGAPGDIEDAYPLAPLQQGMLFRTLYAPEAELYFEQLGCRLVGDLDPAAFSQALQRVVDRHPALRTAFFWEEIERPLQVVHRTAQIPWVFEDWRGEAVPESRLRDFLAADRSRGFDLASPPLMRAALLRLSEGEHRFVWSFHHLLFDGWCFALLIEELVAFYDAARSGREVHLPPSPPYRDYIAWLGGRDRAAEERFWRERLAGFTEATPLPLDAPAALAAGGREPEEEELVLPGGRAAALEGFARGRKLTLNTIVQAAWGLLLARYSGRRDVVYGSVVSGRPAELPGVESMVGLFINTLPSRLEADPQAAVGEWLAQVQARQSEARTWEWSPLADVQRWSAVPAGEPLFHSLYVFENAPSGGGGGAVSSGALEILDVALTERTDYPLTLAAVPGAPASPGLALRLGHDQRCEPATARRLLGHLAALLEGLAEDPERRLGDLPMLSEAERRQLLQGWNRTQPDAGAEVCLHHLFEEQAASRPEALALISGAGRLSYGELDRRANRLAHELRRLGVGPEGRVALLAERSVDMIAGVMGILKAGGVYVPIDPETPKERLAFLLEDSRPRAVLVHERLAPRLPEHGVATLFLDGFAEGGEPEPPESGVTPANLAYVIYTSGSTGVPKGVMVRHGAVAAYARAVAAAYGIGPEDRALQFASLSFDASAEEIFSALIQGAALAIRTGAADEPARFLDRCRELELTLLSLPTAYWHQLAAAVDLEDLPWPPSVRLVVLGGERALPERWMSWTRKPGAAVRLVNAYGPTEATIAATLHEHRGAADPAAVRREVPIGRPLPYGSAHGVDEALEPVPVGAPGELLLGGQGLARGYLGQPALTAERFVPDPFSGEAGERLYRTGDLARRLSDGSLEFAGRLDAQVKVRGFRIELEEVEAALAACPGIREAAVAAREDGSGNLRLAAYVVPLDGQGDLDGLAEHLAGRLPAYMVPADFALVPSLPLTPAGKVDRRALAQIEPQRREAGEGGRPSYVAPGNPVEVRLAAIWAELLQIERVGAHDDFFALGGHSLLATQLASRVRRELGVELPLARLFELRRLDGVAREVIAGQLAAATGEGSGLDEMLADLDGLSDEEALALLAEETSAGGMH